MDWTIEYNRAALRELRKIDRSWQRRILDYMDALIDAGEPRSRGKPLIGPLSGFWRYRVGDYRIICLIEDSVMTVHVVNVEHWRNVYR